MAGLGVLVTAWLAMSPAAGQTPAPPSPTTPGSANAPARRDLRGIWQAVNSAAWDIQDHPAQRFPGLAPRFSVPAGQGVVEGNDIPYQPWALARKKENYEKRLTADPEANCYLPGVPRITYMPHPFQIFQFADRVVILYEYLHTTRVIYTNGTPHLTIDAEFWMGDSRGRWEGDSLVVDVTHFTDQTWFDRTGNFHSNAMHVIERYTRTSPDLMQYEVTIEDPKVFTRPWKMTMPLYRRHEQNLQLLDFECYALAREGASKDGK